MLRNPEACQCSVILMVVTKNCFICWRSVILVVTNISVILPSTFVSFDTDGCYQITFFFFLFFFFASNSVGLSQATWHQLGKVNPNRSERAKSHVFLYDTMVSQIGLSQATWHDGLPWLSSNYKSRLTSWNLNTMKSSKQTWLGIADHF